MMSHAKRPDGEDTPFRFRIVGHVSRLPAPVSLTMPGGDACWMHLITREEWEKLGPADDPGGFEQVRPGIYSRFCRPDGSAWD